VLATWNVHGFVWRDGRHDCPATLERVKELAADVVALQEVEAPAACELAALARRLGYEAHLGITFRRDDVPYGNAVLTRLAASDLRRLDLSLPGHEPRGALDLRLDWKGLPLRVVATHLGLDAAERREQARRLADHLAAHPGPEHEVLALLGDFNDWTPWARTLGPLEAMTGPLSRLRTFPSGRPLLALDRVAVRSARHRVALEVVRDGGFAAASDHLPLRARVQHAEDPPEGAGDPGGEDVGGTATPP